MNHNRDLRALANATNIALLSECEIWFLFVSYKHSTPAGVKTDGQR